mgnify:CR=1 FL=1
MIIPSYLRQLGYMDYPLLSLLDTLSYRESPERIDHVWPWSGLRDVFEFISCMEEAVSRIDSLPTGSDLNTSCLVPARYDSAALVFFAQATLDNIAVWLNSAFKLGLNNTSIAFYSKEKKMRKKLGEISNEFEDILIKSDDFITELNEYRMHWLHKIAGGAKLYADDSPGAPGTICRIMIPLSPAIDRQDSDHLQRIKIIEETRSRNNGEWLIPVAEFAHDKKEKTIELVLELLRVAHHCKQARA